MDARPRNRSGRPSPEFKNWVCCRRDCCAPRWYAVSVEHSIRWALLSFRCTMNDSGRSGIETRNRDLLEKLHRETSGPFTSGDAARSLSLDVRRARRLLAYFASRGWLSRVRRGLYTTVPLGAAAPSKWHEDPWVVAGSTFAPCYIGGWSACEHWGLTEQVFRDVVVVTAGPIRKRRQTIQGTPFHLKVVSQKKLFGTRPVWRGETRIQISDPSKTIVDVLDEPGVGGGIRHIADIIAAYFQGEHCNEEVLLEYATRLGNRAVFKRLGYLVERLRLASEGFVRECEQRKSKGLSALDPGVSKKGRIVKRWNLRVNVTIRPAEESG